MAHTKTASDNDRIYALLMGLGLFAFVGLLAGGFGAGFIDALGTLARAIATGFGASKEVAKIVEIGAEALGRIAKVLWF